jgi:hypothetical protein
MRSVEVADERGATVLTVSFKDAAEAEVPKP